MLRRSRNSTISVERTWTERSRDTMGYRLLRFLELSWEEHWLLAEACVLLPVVMLGLRVLGFKRCLALAAAGRRERHQTVSHEGEASLNRAKDIAKIVGSAARNGPYKAACLSQSLALSFLLHRRGIKNKVHLGVRKGENELEAHAWVECAGLALNQAEDVNKTFRKFDSAIAVEPVHLAEDDSSS